MGNTMKNKDLSVLNYVWGQYCGYSATSREKKASLGKWQKLVLCFTITGAVFGVLSQNLEKYALWSQCLGAFAGVLIALSAYFSKEFIKPEKERLWVQARSIAEVLKSEAYLYVTGVHPYDTREAAEKLNEKAAELEARVKGFTAMDLKDKEKKEMPTKPMTIECYIKERIEDQRDGYYIPTADKYEKYAKRWNIVRWVLGVIGVILAVFNGMGISGYIGGWVAVVSTITVTVVAHISANRYNYLMLSYRSAAQNLKRNLSEWGGRIITDKELIIKCEETISSENKVWLLEWSKEKEPG